MSEIDQLISSYFTRGSHHKNVSVILVTQNLFHPNKHFRTASLNAQYMIIFKNPRDSLQIKYLGRSILTSGTPNKIHHNCSLQSRVLGDINW